MLKAVTFSSHGEEVHGTLIIPQKLKNKNPGVVLIHGFGSNEKNYIPLGERLAEIGIVAFTINLRGHKGNNNVEDFLKVKDGFEDGLASFDFLTSFEFIDKERIGICGASFGGGICAYVSGRRKVKSIVLRAPATYSDYLLNLTLPEILKEEGDKFNNMENIFDTIPIKSLEEFKGYLLIITSENDEVIPKRMTDAFLHAARNAAHKDLTKIKDATHGLDNDIWKEKFRHLTIDWFQKTL